MADGMSEESFGFVNSPTRAEADQLSDEKRLTRKYDPIDFPSIAACTQPSPASRTIRSFFVNRSCCPDDRSVYSQSCFSVHRKRKQNVLEAIPSFHRNGCSFGPSCPCVRGSKNTSSHGGRETNPFHRRSDRASNGSDDDGSQQRKSTGASR